MKFNYKLQRLCGSYYGYNSTNSGSSGGSNVVYDSTGNLLLSAVSNRVQVLDLKSHTVRTLPVEARSSIKCLALSPNTTPNNNNARNNASATCCLLVTVDVQNYVLLIHFHKGIILHRMHLKQSVKDVQFSPNGQYLAIACGRQVQVWCLSSLSNVRELAPLVLHRTFTGMVDAVTCVSWSSDGSVLAAGSREGSCRLWTLHHQTGSTSTGTTSTSTPFTLLAGHKRAVVGVYLVDDSTSSGSSSTSSATLLSVSEDGALVTWKLAHSNNNQWDEETTLVVGNNNGNQEEQQRQEQSSTRTATATTLLLAQQLADGGATWKVHARHYFGQQEQKNDGDHGGLVSATSYCPNSQLLAVGFTSGLFGLYELPSVANIHTLSVGNGQMIKACCLNNPGGDWLAIACPKSQQLLVWEWRSESYVIKQRGHAYGMRCMAYSPDGIIVCTGGEDGKLKLWNANSGFCYVTYEKTHTAPVTAVAFANSSVVVSASLDGTVRAHDLYRYRTFRTLTTPTPVQFTSLAVDPSGEIVTAGSAGDLFHIYAWSLQTGKLLDVFTGHSGPVCDLCFLQSHNNGGTLASASWDGTVKLWDIYKTSSSSTAASGNVPSESLQHTSDVVCVTCRPDGKEICTGTVGGLLSFWHVESAKLKFEIDGRRDIAGGRKMNDRMTADNNAASRYFTSVCYSADGTCVLAGGNSKYVCIYEVSQQILLKKFQVTYNRSLDGVLDELNSKHLGDFGPMHEHEEDSGDEATYGALHLPGARREDDGSRTSKVEVLTMQVSFSSTGREWAAVSGEGLHVYSLDDDMVFDPISLTEEVTPSAILTKLASREYSLALHMALHLNEFALVKQVLEEIPYDSIPLVVQNTHVNDRELERLIHFLAKIVEESPHVEFYVQWCLQLLKTRGMYMDRQHNRSKFLRALRSMHKAIQSRGDELQAICNSNSYTLEVLQDHMQLPPLQKQEQHQPSDDRR